MSTTRRSDVANVVPEILQEAIKGQFAGAKALFGSPAVVNDFSASFSQGGDTVTVPYFGTIGEFEDISNEGDALTPSKLSSSEETASVVHVGKAFEVSSWARMAAGGQDPYKECARQVVEAAMRKADAALITAATASLVSVSMVSDITAAADPYLSYNAVIDARMFWGDEQNDIALMVMHSAASKDLLKLADNSGRPLLNLPENAKLGSFAGIPLLISDKLTPSSTTYTTLLLKRGALVYWANGSPSIMTDKDILADTDVAAVHVYHVAHRYSRLAGSTKGGVVHLKHKVRS